MPFGKEFNDIYKFGIKGAADEAGAYAERVDEQMFEEGILERIFNQINKADVIVADMTGRNPNVFYEVGYAHALNKLVVLLTQTADDIPFDLKHRPHTLYSGEIETLRNRLAERLRWAIEESRRRGRGTAPISLAVSCNGIDLPELSLARYIPMVEVEEFSQPFRIDFAIRNTGRETSDRGSHRYLFTEERSPIKPEFEREDTHQLFPLDRFRASEADKSKLGLAWQYRLPFELYEIPPGGYDSLTVVFSRTGTEGNTARLSLRLHIGAIHFDYLFQLVAGKEEAAT